MLNMVSLSSNSLKVRWVVNAIQLDLQLSSVIRWMNMLEHILKAFKCDMQSNNHWAKGHFEEYICKKDKKDRIKIGVKRFPSFFLNSINNLSCDCMRVMGGGLWSYYYLPNENPNIILRATIARDWKYACPHCHLTIDLNEPWAQQVVASCCLICITLHIFSRKS